MGLLPAFFGQTGRAGSPWVTPGRESPAPPGGCPAPGRQLRRAVEDQGLPVLPPGELHRLAQQLHAVVPAPLGGENPVVRHPQGRPLQGHGHLARRGLAGEGLHGAAGIVLPEGAEPQAGLGGGVAPVPALAAEGGQLGGDVAGIVPEDHPDPVPVHLQQAHGGVVPVAGGACLLQAHTLQGPQQGAQGGPVAGGGDGLAGALGGHLPDGGEHPLPDLGEGLGPPDAPEVRALVEVDVHLGVHALDVPPAHLLPCAQPDLPQQGQGAEGQISGDVQGGGGGAGPGEVAAIDGVNALLPEPLPQAGQLAVALGGNGAVVLTVGHPEKIAFGLGMAD